MLKGARKYLLLGLGTIFPLFISLYLVYLLLSLSDRFAGARINNFLFEQYGFMIPGLGFVLILVVVFLTGFIASRLIGKKLLAFFEMMIVRIPVLASLYPSAKQFSDLVFRAESQKDFRVVLVEFPYKGAYVVSFVTNDKLKVLSDAAGEKLVNVFVPLAPSPFSGFLILVAADKIKPLNISFETAIKYIVSGGVIFNSNREE